MKNNLTELIDDDNNQSSDLHQSSPPLALPSSESVSPSISSSIIKQNSKSLIINNHDHNHLHHLSSNISDNKQLINNTEISADIKDTNLLVDEDPIVLIPFNHQVGGHTQLMLLNQNTLCKPLVPRELVFYLNIPHQLIDFVPRYKGVVEIRHNDSKIPTLYHPNKKNISPQSLPSKPELKVRLSSCNEGLFEKLGYSSRPNQQYFMLLENIASKYHLPCVLDLKMGTRQHSDDASDEKRHRQMAKCAASTSATLGVRICGMQVYQKIGKNSYKIYHRDKYYGRRIKNENGFKNELEIFFQNRLYQIKPIISRLKKLRAKVIDTLQTTSLRFFSTSLLIVTEGCSEVHQTKMGLKHVYSDGEEDYYDDEFDDDYFSDSEVDYDDDDFLHNDNHNNITTTTTVKNDQIIVQDESSTSSIDSITGANNNNLSTNNIDISQLYSEQTIHCNRDHNYHRFRTTNPTIETVPETDVRLIDFAHTSFGSSSSSSDYGFILGLDNLIRLLNEILFKRRIHGPNNKRRRSSSSINIEHHHHNNHHYNSSPSSYNNHGTITTNDSGNSGNATILAPSTKKLIKQQHIVEPGPDWTVEETLIEPPAPVAANTNNTNQENDIFD